MNISALKERTYNYLSGRSDCDTDKLLDECIEELPQYMQFNYTYRKFDTPPEFLNKEPYLTFLKGSEKVIISVMTLGNGVDRRIKYLSRTDTAKCAVFDALTSAALEELSDEYERGIADNLSYRFCIGYGGSDLNDLKYVFDILKSEKTGVVLTETNYMLPSKSMAGILAVNVKRNKTCADCILNGGCTYVKEGRRCYGSEKKF